MQLFAKPLPKVTPRQKRVLFILWLVFSNSLLLFGGTINPLTASEQLNRRLHLSSLLDSRNPDVNALNDTFEQFLQKSEQFAPSRDHFNSVVEYEAHLVEIFTYLFVKQKTDLMQHLTIDHYPTIGEVMRSSADDVNGRIIFAAALLIYRGYNTWALVGPWHSWVEIILENGASLQILAKKGIGMNIWYLRFNDRESHFRPVQTVVFVFYELLLAAFILGVLFCVWTLFSQSSFLRQVTKGLSIFVVASALLFIVGLAIILLFYWILWGV